MAIKIRQILHSFEQLPETDKHRVVAELVRWSAKAPQPPVSDDELVAAADYLLVARDNEESRCG